MKLFSGKATKTALIAAALAITPTVAFAAGGNLQSPTTLLVSLSG